MTDHRSTRAALFVGDVTHDLFLAVSEPPGPDGRAAATALRECVGGGAVNAAMACLRGGVPARPLARVGEDPIGTAALRTLAVAGIDTRHTTRPGPTARAFFLIGPGGGKRLVLHPGVSMSPDASEARTASLDGVGWVHHVPHDPDVAAALAERCHQRDIPWSLDLDPSTFPDGIETLSSALEGAAVVFCNAASLRRIGPDPIDTLFGLGVERVIATRGAEGVALHGPANPPMRLHAPPVEAIDTTGAGDCLAGRFVAARLRRRDALAGLVEAIEAASISCTREGSWSSYPWYAPESSGETWTP